MKIAVLLVLYSVHLFYLFPNMTEGHLDAYRQALVQNHHLSKLAVVKQCSSIFTVTALCLHFGVSSFQRLGLHHHLLYTHGVDFCLDSTFTHARSDAFEAFMGKLLQDVYVFFHFFPLAV